MLQGESTTTSVISSHDALSAQEKKVSQKSWSYAAWLFLCQVYALCWKQYLIKKRRPLSTIFEIIAPALMLLVLAYAMALSPSIPAPPFVYSVIPTTVTNTTISTTPPDNATLAFLQLLEQADLYNALSPTSYFETAFLPMLSNPNSSIGTQIASLMIANTAAAAPFVIPGFDQYVRMMGVAQVMVGKSGRKTLQHLSSMLWHMMNLGKIAFTPASQDVVDMLAFFNATTASFGSSVVFCSPFYLNGSVCNGFESESLALAYADTTNTVLWAVVEISTFDISNGVFDYTIRMNASLVPSTGSIIDKFPQGIGSAYANYIYSGFMTIELELNEYFRRKARQSDVLNGRQTPPPLEFGIMPLFESVCNDVLQQPYMFSNETTFLQQVVLQTLLAGAPNVQTTVVPSPFPSDAYPCQPSVTLFCSAANSTQEMLNCLVAANASVGSCYAAMQFIEQCEQQLYEQCGVSGLGFFRQVPTAAATSTCIAKLEQVRAECGASSSYGQLVSTTAQLMVPCVLESNQYCKVCTDVNFANCPPDYQCLRALQQFHVGALSEVCGAALNAVSSCGDDLATICPFDPATQSMRMFPTICMHMYGQSLLSETCTATDFMTMVEYAFGFSASTVVTPAPQYLCRTARTVSAAFRNAIAAGAFPAPGFNQNQFYANSGALIGLVIALSFLYPFTAHIRMIVQERDKGQRLFLILIGVHHSVILITYTLIGMLTMFVSSILATIVASLVFPDVATNVIFSLLFTYALSLLGLASLVSSFFSRTRYAGAVAPFIIFTLSIPAFVMVGDVNIGTAILSPSVVILAADLFVGYSQSSATPAVFTSQLKTATSVLFGLGLLYLLIALIIEQLRVSSMSMGFWGKIHRFVTDGAFGAYRVVARPMRRTRIYRSLNRQDVAMGGNSVYGEDVDVEMGPQEDDAEGDRANGASQSLYENYDESTVADGATNASQLRFEIGGVRHDGQRTSPTVQTGSGKRVIQGRCTSWRVCFALQNVASDALQNARRRLTLGGLTAYFYQNKLNCIVGGSASGKSSLLRLLMGEQSPILGNIQVNGDDISLYNRQNLGVCLQRDVYWDQLSVAEHIELVQLVKGNIDLNVLNAETKTLLGVLDLEELRDLHADSLSQGIRRKLAVAMAFAGGSRTVILDEPTAAIDPTSRKAVWHLLQSNVNDRCIIVASSHVEELNHVNHLVMLSSGRIKCAGTPAFIKEALGSHSILSLSRGPRFASEVVVRLVLDHAPSAKLVNNVGHELCFRLSPEDEPGLPALLQLLDRHHQAGDVSNVNVSDHRLDEILMRVTYDSQSTANFLRSEVSSSPLATESSIHSDDGDGASSRYRAMPQGSGDGPTTGGSINNNTPLADSDSDQSHEEDESLSTSAMGSTIGSDRELAQRLKGFALFRQTFNAVMAKRSVVFLDTILASLLQFLFPLVCIAIAMDLLNIQQPPSERLQLSTGSLFGDTEMLYAHGHNDGSHGQVDAHRVPFLNGLGTTPFFMPDMETSVDMSLYLQQTANDHWNNRYGALVLNDTFMICNVLGVMAGQVLTNNTVLWQTDTILHNTSSPHSLPAYLAALGNHRLWSWKNATKGSITVYSYPLPQPSPPITTASIVINLISSILLLVPFTFYPAQFVSFIVKERESGLLSAEYASLLTPCAYWLANLLWNMMTFGLFSMCSIFMYMTSQKALISGFDEAMYTWVVLMLYGLCVTVISYCLSTCFKKHSTAQNAVTMFHFTCGFVLVVAVNAVELLPDNEHTQSAKQANERWAKLFRFLPAYALGESFIRLSMIPLKKYLSPGADHSVVSVIGPSIELMWLFPLYLFLLIVYQQYGKVAVTRWMDDYVRYPCRFVKEKLLRAASSDYRPLRHAWEDDSLLMVDDDPEVGAERIRASGRNGINLLDVWKHYGSSKTFSALNSVALHVEKERLLIVGPNGSGKTTLMNCAATVLPISHGQLAIDGVDALESTSSMWKAREKMGFTSELAGVNSHATPFLMLQFMADFRGMRPSPQRNQHIDFLLRLCGLKRYAHRTCGQLGFAVRRRLSVAMSLVGFPPVLILDEPTTGLDPIGRRKFWAALQAVPNATSVLITTQHFEDVEMIADRVAFLDHGKIRQIGSVAELKRRFLRRDIVVTVYLLATSSSSQQQHSAADRRATQKSMLLEFFQEKWPDATTLIEESNSSLTFRLQVDEPTLSSTQLPSLPNEGNSALPAASPSHRMTLSDVYTALLQQRREWRALPVWQSVSQRHRRSVEEANNFFAQIPTAAASVDTTTASPPPPAAHPTIMPELNAEMLAQPFEFSLGLAPIDVAIEAVLGARSSSVQHLRRMLNLDSSIAVRSIVE